MQHFAPESLDAMLFHFYDGPGSITDLAGPGRITDPAGRAGVERQGAGQGYGLGAVLGRLGLGSGLGAGAGEDVSTTLPESIDR